MRQVPENFIQHLADIVDNSGLLTMSADMAPYLVDERQRYRGNAIAVVRPASTEQVSAIVRLCLEAGVAIVPQGGNTSLCGAATPFEHGEEILMSLARMNRIREIDAVNYTITVEAGVILADVQRAAEESDRLFPLSLGGEGTARIGGNLSTNAGGTGVLRYGTARELALGLEVVLPDGRVWDGLSGLRKDNTGYDLKQLFMGAEGTLGIITAAVLKLFPRPDKVQTAFVAVPDPRTAVEFLTRARIESGDRVITFELIPRLPLDLVLQYIPGTRDPLANVYEAYVLFELASSQPGEDLRSLLENIVSNAMDAGLALDAAIAESGQQAIDFWRLRESLPEAQKLAGASIKHDVSVPISRIADFLDEASAKVEAAVPGLRVCAFGHLGDGNIHFNLCQPEGEDGAAFESRMAELNRVVHDTVVAMRGSISAEHGIGRLRKDELAHYASDVSLDLMRRIKVALDPEGIMNPGKVI